ncbi:MAG: N-acetylmuramoyl-L-alanine amidase [Phycisphaerales bacterium]|nr:MAG: N-acetylmuramoyl-L-alanine amidase [Phycisphaerales bacterium]
MTHLALHGLHRLVLAFCVVGLLLVRDGCDDEPDDGAPEDARVVVIDAGHGGNDPGTLGGVAPTAPEKDITLAISAQVATLLESQGVRVVLSRDSDVFVELDDRAALARRHQAGLFVSIHADAAENADASGATLYIRPDGDAASRRAADAIVSTFRLASIKCRGTARAEFRVLVGHKRPAVLVECGYLTNADDARNLNDPHYQRTIAAAIAEGIIVFLAD